MAGDYTFIPKEQIEFTPHAEELIEAFEKSVRTHFPDHNVVCADCGGCDNLHVHASIDKRPSRTMIGINIPPNMWKRRTKQ